MLQCRLVLIAASAAVFAAVGCGTASPPGASSTSGSASTGAASSGTGSGTSSGTASGSASGVGPSGSSGGTTSIYDAGFVTVGALDGGPQTKLPALPPLSNVVASLDDDSADITFDPVDGALDYRVYPLPNDSDITVASDGHVVVHDAIYHCAGNRESASPYLDKAAMVASDAINTQVDNEMVGGYLRTLANATIGYVYTQPGPGLIPVYSLGESDANADSTCYFARWAASRVKDYTTSASERTQDLADFARDDGIAFYVPATADSTTTQIYVDNAQVGSPGQDRYYFPAGAEANVHPNKQPAFLALTAQAAGTVPLMRVYYANECGWSHDELSAGTERFNRAYHQGDQLPWWSVMWPGLTGPTTLVVEALDSGCPFQGHLSPQSMPSVTAYYGTMPIVHQPWFTIDDVRASSPTTEVFVNGQAAGTNQPKAIARSFVNVAPQPHAPMDFFANFAPNSTPETFTPAAWGAPDGNCYQTWRQQSPSFDQFFTFVETGPDAGTGLYTFGQVMGEYWISYADVGADTNGKYRLTANKKANMDASSFLHVTMEVDDYSTARRYPQILISDQNAPIQYTLAQGHTIVVQTIAEISGAVFWPVDYEVELCNLRTWDVNQQCPAYNFHDFTDDAGNVLHLAPNDEVGEHGSVDHRVLFDAYASTQRIYLFLDGKPYACANLPTPAIPTGPVTVTWGDVLYHSAVDYTFAFHAAHMQIEQRRHFDNLGFSSGVPAPGWDETRLPCAAAISP